MLEYNTTASALKSKQQKKKHPEFLRICHDFIWYLPISSGAKYLISGNQSLTYFAELYIFSLLTLLSLKMLYRNGQITPNCMTRPSYSQFLNPVLSETAPL